MKHRTQTSRRPTKCSSKGQSGPPSTETELPARHENARVAIPRNLMQQTLNVFQDAYTDQLTRACNDNHEQDSLQTRIQCLKKHLFERNFTAAFGNDTQLLEAYCLRWSPSRALCYVAELLRLDIFNKQHPNNKIKPEQIRIACVGGGAGAELIASCMAYYYSSQMLTPAPHSPAGQKNGDITTATFLPYSPSLHLTILDVANWSPVLQRLYRGFVQTMQSQAAPPDTLPQTRLPLQDSLSYSGTNNIIQGLNTDYKFVRGDVLDLDGRQIGTLLEHVHVVTIFFTLNELFATSIAKTTSFLLRLRDSAPLGAYLLVIDSAGSYSNMALNRHGNKYPMQWLLEHALVGRPDASGPEQSSAWAKIRSEESTWCRLPPGLVYPLTLEDMRYQIHVYNHIGPSSHG